jgi:rubrerythrin
MKQQSDINTDGVTMDKKDVFAVSGLMESISREDFAIHLYGRQHHRDPFATVPLAPLYYVLNEVYYLTPSPVILGDLLGIMEIEILHKKRFTEAAASLNPNNQPVPKISFPDGLFASVRQPEAEHIPGMKTALRIITTDIVQEQRAQLIYEYFARETTAQMSALFKEIATQEIAHRKIFEQALKDVQGRKKINVICPVCGKIITMEPEDGFLGGCAFCMSKLMLRITDDDFVVQRRQ